MYLKASTDVQGGSIYLARTPKFQFLVNYDGRTIIFEHFLCN